MAYQTTKLQHTFAYTLVIVTAATMLKARQYADAAESTRPKKMVKILKKPTLEIKAEADEDYVVENLRTSNRYWRECEM